MDSLIFFFLGGGEIHKMNLGRTCFDRVRRKSETNNTFLGLSLMLAQRRRRWANSKLTVGQCLCLLSTNYPLIAGDD